jgi:hypothetical protein
MPDFVVTAVKGSEPWSNDKGQFIGYLLTVRTAEGREIDANINRKPTSAPPVVGETIDANLQPSSNPHFPPLLKANFSGGGGQGGGRSPEQTAAIQRQHSQEMALRYAAIRAEKELLPEPFKLEDLRKVIDWFEKDIAPSQRTVHGLPVRNEPEKTGAPEPTTPNADYPEVHVGDVPWEGDAA